MSYADTLPVNDVTRFSKDASPQKLKINDGLEYIKPHARNVVNPSPAKKIFDTKTEETQRLKAKVTELSKQKQELLQKLEQAQDHIRSLSAQLQNANKRLEHYEKSDMLAPLHHAPPMSPPEEVPTNNPALTAPKPKHANRAMNTHSTDLTTPAQPVIFTTHSQQFSPPTRQPPAASRTLSNFSYKSDNSSSHKLDKASARISMIGVPFRGGQPKGGVEEAPAALRKAGIVLEVQKLGWRIDDTGDIPIPQLSQDDPEGHIKNPRSVGTVCKILSDSVYAHASQNNFVLTLGGDHSLAIGSISGILRARPNTGIVWVDAHADINTHESSPSGNMHGMPVAFLMGLSRERSTVGFEWMEGLPTLGQDSIVYVGLRDVDLGEKEILRQLGIRAFSMTEVDKYGIGRVMEMAMHHLSPSGSDRPIHISFDVDGIDVQNAPATGTAVTGGLTFREARYLCECVAATGNLTSLDIVEVNPKIGDEEKVQTTLDTAIMIAKHALGERLL